MKFWTSIRVPSSSPVRGRLCRNGCRTGSFEIIITNIFFANNSLSFKKVYFPMVMPFVSFLWIVMTPRKINGWNLKITPKWNPENHFFHQTSVIMFHVNFLGWNGDKLVAQVTIQSAELAQVGKVGHWVNTRFIPWNMIHIVSFIGIHRSQVVG